MNCSGPLEWPKWSCHFNLLAQIQRFFQSRPCFGIPLRRFAEDNIFGNMDANSVISRKNLGSGGAQQRTGFRVVAAGQHMCKCDQMCSYTFGWTDTFKRIINFQIVIMIRLHCNIPQSCDVIILVNHLSAPLHSWFNISNISINHSKSIYFLS